MSFIQKLFLQTRLPLAECKRFRGKYNVQRPQKPFFRRQLTLDLCKPIYPKEKIVMQTQLCENVKDSEKQVIDNPFERILGRECANWFNHSKMVAFLHLNPVPMSLKMKTFTALKKENMHLRGYGKKVVSLAVTGTPYENILCLFNSHTNIIFSEEVKADTLLKILKKAPQLVLIAGIVDGKLVSKNELVEYSKLSIDIARSQLCQLLERGSMNLVQQMTQHQTSLVNNLDSYVQIQESLLNNSESPSEHQDNQTPQDNLTDSTKIGETNTENEK